MKISRHKRTQRTLSFYANNFGFREPYQVLIDGTFCQHALNNKVDVADQVPRLLEGRVDIVTTSCAVTETEELLPMTYGACLILKKFPARKCGHKESIGGAACFRSLFKGSNPNRYFIATQDQKLQEMARKKPPVPIIYLHGPAPVLEKPSPKCEKKADEKLNEKTNVSERETKVLEKLRSDLGIASARKKKKKSGPNPLSCKKSQSKPTVPTSDTHEAAKKRTRKRLKIPKHVKAVLKT